jgi:DNA polymerase
VIYLDFETRSAANLKKIGAFLYAQDESTEVMCNAYSFDDSPVVRLWHPGFEDQTPMMAKTKAAQALPPRNLIAQPYPTELFERIEAGEPVEAHNSFFERCIWHFQCVLKMGWPKIAFEQWRCSAAKAATYGLPRRLEFLTGPEGLNLKKHSKDMGGHRIMLKLSQPRTKTKNGPQPKWHQNRDELLKLFRYCVGDVRAEKSASHHLRDLPPDELKAWRMNQQMNARGIHIDRGLCVASIALAEEYRERAGKRFAEITDGEIDKHTQKKRLKKWLNSKGIQVDSVAKPILEEVVKTAEGDVKKMLTVWMWANKTSVAKYVTALRNIGDDDIIRDTSMYHGAHTGRDAGKKVQFLNLPRNCPKNIEGLCEAIKDHSDLGEWGNPIEAASRALRGMVTSREGRDIIAVDYKSVEARGAFWVSGHEKGLENFRKLDAGELPGQDIYTLQASDMYGRLILKKDDTERQGGKVATLGCTYQMGENALITFALTLGVVLTPEQSADIVTKFRASNKVLVDFWYECENSAIEAVKFKGSTVKQGYLQWRVHGKFLFCRLPSGRCLSYYRPSLKMNRVHPRPTVRNPDPEPFDKLSLRYWGEYKSSRFGWVFTYGGKLTENIVQALCRDIMRDGMFRTEEAGYPTLFTVYDEVIAEPRKGFGSVEEFCDLLTQVPEWAPGFPIMADGWRANRYRKD